MNEHFLVSFIRLIRSFDEILSCVFFYPRIRNRFNDVLIGRRFVAMSHPVVNDNLMIL